MIQKESVKQRINRQEVGISFTEFSYMILQAYDFSVLHKRYGCTLQIGGSDQWGNITAGIDLTRRLWQSTVYGLTLPLITKSDGSKFGKTEAGTIWLSADKTSPYAFYQFWLNVADADVYRFLAYFTFLTLSEINQIEQQDKARASKPQAQAILAQEVTRLVHGEAGLAAAQRITQALFNDDLNQLTVEDFAQLKLDGLATTELPLTKVALVEALVKTGLASSNRAAREFTSNGAVKVNGNKQLAVDTELNAAQGFFGSYFVIKRGKKLFHLLCLKS
jgi:tyrosyl-tRNA synthetase